LKLILIFVSIAGAMKALNAKGIVHRDLKPQVIIDNRMTATNKKISNRKIIKNIGFCLSTL
jgi:serine/threonine protein kinase